MLFSHFCSEMENSFLQLGDIISFVWKHEQLLDLVPDCADNFCILEAFNVFVSQFKRAGVIA